MDKDTDKRKDISEYSIKELRQICQSSAPNPAMETYSGRFTRIFSIYLTKLFLYTKISPNQITVISFFIFIASAFAYFGSYYFTLLGPFLYFMSIVVDGNDGEVARFRRQGSQMGAVYVEPVSHDIQYGLFYIIVSVALYYNGASALVLIAGGVATTMKLMYRLLTLRFWYIYYAGTPRETKEEQLQVYKDKSPFIRFLYFVNRNVFGVAGTLFPLLFATIFEVVDWLLYFYAIGFLALFLALLFKQMALLSKATHLK
jgi:phosphatidylglycerophosphate synthase